MLESLCGIAATTHHQPNETTTRHEEKATKGSAMERAEKIIQAKAGWMLKSRFIDARHTLLVLLSVAVYFHMSHRRASSVGVCVFSDIVGAESFMNVKNIVSIEKIVFHAVRGKVSRKYFSFRFVIATTFALTLHDAAR